MTAEVPSARRTCVPSVRLSELFANGTDTLLIHGRIFGPATKTPCTSCPAMFDRRDGMPPHVRQRVPFAVTCGRSRS